MATKPHSKRKAGGKAKKRKAAKRKESEASGKGGDQQPNARALNLASSGRARKQRARTAEREQRRLHGAAPPLEAPAPLQPRALHAHAPTTRVRSHRRYVSASLPACSA
jgi:ribosome biogenesis protein BMS1